ncbi:MAG: ABC transporter ATP-binding protein [Candidatus Omnitrophica bacterium]|nr:ABC transporter ATP-binding protein [Candidatus Omnitrophota bacterium]
MILEIYNLTKTFGKIHAVDGVSFSVEERENLCIIGESGCGKSTLAKLIMGLLERDGGQIRIDRHIIQMVFQDPYSSLDPLWSVRSILKEALGRQRLSVGQQQERMQAILEAVNLSGEILNRFPHEFSGGERQRIAIARALLTNPKILILDEAVSSLDILVQKQIMDLLKDLKGQFHLTYILISHNLRVVKNFSGRIAVMREGKIIEIGASEDIFKKPQQSYTQQLLKAAFDYQI